jgi:hypothetical protein
MPRTIAVGEMALQAVFELPARPDAGPSGLAGIARRNTGMAVRLPAVGVRRRAGAAATTQRRRGRLPG